MPLAAPWCTLDDVVCGPCAEYGPDPSPFFDYASEILYDLTEHAYPGVASDTIRPPSTCGCRAFLRDGWWTYVGDYRFGCSCNEPSLIRLPGFPAREVTQVVIDGLVVDPARYRIDQHRDLVFQPDLLDVLGSRQGWPLFQRASQPPTEIGTWEVTYTYGIPPTAAGRRSAAILACEIALGCTPGFEEQCRLPSNTVNVSAKNVTQVIADPDKLRDNGETGIPEVDAWIRADRWGRQHRGATVLAPRSTPKHRRKTST